MLAKVSNLSTILDESDWVPQDEDDARPVFGSNRRRGGPRASQRHKNKDDDYDPDVEMVDAPTTLRRESIRQSPRGAQKRNRPGSSRSETASSLRGGGQTSPVNPKPAANLTAKEGRGSSERQTQKESEQAQAEAQGLREKSKSAEFTSEEATPTTSANASPTKRSSSGWATINGPAQKTSENTDSSSFETNYGTDANGGQEKPRTQEATRTPLSERPNGRGATPAEDMRALAAAALENDAPLPLKPAVSAPGGVIETRSTQQAALVPTATAQSSEPSAAEMPRPVAAQANQFVLTTSEKASATAPPGAKTFTITAYEDGEKSWSGKTTGESLVLVVDESGKIVRTLSDQPCSVMVDATTVMGRERTIDDQNIILSLQIHDEKTGKDVVKKLTFMPSQDKTAARKVRDFIQWVRDAAVSPDEPMLTKSAALLP
jgi:hypothetical protein